MPGLRKFVIGAASLAGLWLTAPVQAQQAPPDDGKISFQSSALLKKPKPGLPDVPAPPQAWPRLEAGAVVCRTEGDLDRLAARHAGEPSGGPVDCQLIHNPTAIAIVGRHGPAKTEVRLTSGQGSQVGTTGWTNTFLPERAPASATRAATR
ncbi:MAG: hypothetical protein ACJ8AI_16640 [Rhodopila sp.]